MTADEIRNVYIPYVDDPTKGMAITTALGLLKEGVAQLAELNATQLAILNEWRAHAEWSRERIKDYR